ncbi:unnamed protein product [Pieris macdunnoughi]|uniref:Uncharacterized protein n=1 Tax=Pieris macdunnoughi TaxID=345717 RepID=A0A821MRM9_9NEOP|nr:unnamed protein product [Pieris macdunnoughi]
MFGPPKMRTERRNQNPLILGSESNSAVYLPRKCHSHSPVELMRIFSLGQPKLEPQLTRGVKIKIFGFNMFCCVMPNANPDVC